MAKEFLQRRVWEKVKGGNRSEERNGDRLSRKQGGGAGSSGEQKEKLWVCGLISTEFSNVNSCHLCPHKYKGKIPPSTHETSAELVSGKNLAFPLTSMIAN